MFKKTNIMPENVNKCVFNFDGIAVSVDKMGPDRYIMNIDPGQIDLSYNKLPKEYKKSRVPRIEGAAPGVGYYKWFVVHYSGSGDLHFNNGDVFTYDQLNHILFNIQNGLKKLKEIREDKKIRIIIDESFPITEFEWHGVEIEVERQCDHLGICDDDCKYSISINSEIEFDMPADVKLRTSNSPHFRAEFEKTSTFMKISNETYSLSRYINCESGEQILFKNGEVFPKKKLEYMLFSIKKTLDKYNELGYKLKVEKREDAVEPKNNTDKTSNSMKLMIIPLSGDISNLQPESKVLLKIEGMLSMYAIPDQYYESDKWVCYQYPDGDYVIRHNGEIVKFAESGKDIKLNITGSFMTFAMAGKIAFMLGKCSDTLYQLNHPGFNEIVIRM